MSTDSERDFVGEAEKILAHTTLMIPQREHLQAIQAKLAAAEARVKWLEEGKRIIELARDGVVFRQASIDEWLAAEPTGWEERNA